MRILMIAPHPVYAARGTPISVYNRCVALGSLGHHVDLVTYPVGADRDAPNLRYIRPGRRWLSKWEVPIGMSVPKLVLNLLVAGRAALLAVPRGSRYDAVHSHEEGSLIGIPIARALGVPHVYDMGNEWGTVVGNFGHPGGVAARLVGRLERAVLASSRVTIVQLPATFDRLLGTHPQAALHLIPNVPLESSAAVMARTRNVLDELGLAPSAPVVAYVGSLERYQGIEVLVDAMARVATVRPDAVLVIGGGRRTQIDQLARRAAELGVGQRIRLIGEISPEEVDVLLRAADVLVSPRSSGVNTPLKLFTYLRAGRPIVATDILSHTQVLSADQAQLVGVDAGSIARGIVEVLDSPALTGRLAVAATELSRRYSPESYLAANDAAYSRLGPPSHRTPRRARRIGKPSADLQWPAVSPTAEPALEKGAVG